MPASGRGHRNVMAFAVHAVAAYPDFIDGKIGYYTLASETSISAGTAEATYTSAQVALTGAEMISSGAHR